MTESALQLFKAFAAQEPRRMAECLEKMTDDVSAELARVLDPESAANALTFMNPTHAQALLRKLDKETLANLLGALSSDTISRICRGMPGSETQELFDLLNPRLLSKVKQKLEYAPNTAAAHAHSRVVTATLGQTAREAIGILESGVHKAFDYVYVIDRENTLRGVITVSRLFRAHPNILVDHLMNPDVTVLPAFTSIEGIIRHPGWRSYHALPVCDPHNKFLGALTYGELQRILAEGKTQKTDRIGLIVAFGELYWLGIVGMLEAFSGVRKGMRKDRVH